MTYKFTCDDTAQLEAQAPDIAKAISANAKINIVSKTEATLDIPSSTPLVIGIMPVKGYDLGLSEEAVTKKVSDRIEVMDEKTLQSFQYLK
jgi:hypothetical protein